MNIDGNLIYSIHGEAADREGLHLLSTCWTYTVCQHEKGRGRQNTLQWASVGRKCSTLSPDIREADLEDTLEDIHPYIYASIIHLFMLLSIQPQFDYSTSQSSEALTGWGGGEEDRRSRAVCQEALCLLTHPERSWVEALNRLWICSSAVWVRFTWTECFHTWEGNTGEPSEGSRSSQLPKICNWAKKKKAALQNLTELPGFSLSGNKVASQPSGGRSVGAVSSSWGETNPKTPLYAQIGLHLSVFSFVF